LKLIAIEEALYASTYPQHGFACSLVAMGGDPKDGLPTSEAAQLLPADLASGKKDGYHFNIDHCGPIMVKGHQTNTSFTVFAVPEESHGHGTKRGFCVDQDMKITVDPNGGINCTEPFGVV
jgi:type IV pilus assembly protein PilA